MDLPLEMNSAPPSGAPTATATGLALYPLRFDPIFQYRLWGGRRLADFLSAPLPGDGPIGEAWVLSDRVDQPSRVADGPLKGWTIAQLMAQAPEEFMGKLAPRFLRFPLLLKFLDASAMLSVQVHPADSQTALLPEGESGKTEAWVVLKASPESRIYAGLKAGVTEETLLRALANGTVADELSSFTPKAGDGVFLKAGTVHALGGGIVVFEVQQNSDVTFRLDDWKRVDAMTGHARPLQIKEALASIDFAQGEVGPSIPRMERTRPMLRERLFDCEHFTVRRITGEASISVGGEATPVVVVGLDGSGQVESAGAEYPLGKGEVILLPAILGACAYQPLGKSCLLEISLPATEGQHE